MKTSILWLIAAVLWISALGMFAAGFAVDGLEVLRYAAVADAVAAGVFTLLAAKKWTAGQD